MQHFIKKIKLILLIPCLLQADGLVDFNQLNTLAYQAIQNDQLETALMLYKKIMSIDASDSNVYYNCGYIYTRLNDNAQAIAHYLETLKRTPSNSHAKLGLSKALLACGEFQTAWPLFEHRFSDPELMQRAFGYTNISLDQYAGKRILLRSEWGLGDMMHFVRYAKLLHQQGAHVIVQAFDPLIHLFRLCPYIDQVISVGDPIPSNDLQIPMMSLPMLFKTTVDTVPAPIPYLFADAQLIEQWKNTLAHDKQYKIGICWHAKPIYLEDHITTRRSIPLTLFAPLMQLPASLYSLQKEHGMEESLPGLSIMPLDFDQTNGRFMDTAGLIMNMDLIISADTSIVHLAGALGKEVWVLLPFASEWRWLPGVQGYETRTAWYPSMRLFRQKRAGDWRSVIDEIKTELRHKILCS